MDDVLQVSWGQASARRLERSGLSAPFQDAEAVDVVRAMHAAHAQVMSAAEISVALRMADATRVDVQDALRPPSASLVKTFGPRGTVHLLPAADLPKWLAALSAPPRRVQFAVGVRMTEEQTAAVLEALGRVLADAELTLDELDEAVPEHAGAWAGDLVMPAFQTFWPRWRQAMQAAAHRGVLCFGADRGRKITYTSPRRWLPESGAAAVGSAEQKALLVEFVQDYLRAYGPATPANFAKWLAAPETWAATVFETLAGQGAIVEVGFVGGPAWLASDDLEFPEPELEPEPESLRLLPYFDAYGVGCQPRELLFPGRAYERATARGQAGNYPVLLIGGVVAGVWHLRRSGKKTDITVEPLDELSRGQLRALDAQADRIGEIVQAAPRLTVGPVTVGAHA